MKKYLVTGLIATIPAAVVAWFGYIIISFLANLVGHWSLTTVITGMLIAIAAIFGLGFLLVHSKFVNKTKEWIENQIIDKTPLAKTVYKFSKDIAENALDNKTYDEVVRAYPFGRDNAAMIGFLTSEKYKSVFVPSSPNPFSGQTYSKCDYDLLPDWTYDDVIKYDMSVGMSHKGW